MNKSLTKFQNISDDLLVTIGYIGKIKFAPGTFGSMPALLVLLSPIEYIWLISIFTAIFLSFTSIPSIRRYEARKGNDHSSIVIDETIGMLITLSNPYMIYTPFWILLAFLLFRLFDILKPYPISKLNDRKGALFVIADDIVAGLFSLIILVILLLGYRILPFFLNIFNIL